MKKTVPFVVIYFMAVLLGVGLLFLVSLIPQSILTQHWQEGRAVDFRSNRFSLAVMDDYGTYIDDYMDNLKLDIAYRLNEHSVLTPTAYIGVIDAEYEYGRYWHGYCIIVRPLLILFNLSQIKMIAGVVNLVLFLMLIVRLLRKGGRSIAVSLLFAAYMTNFFVVCLSIQYFNCTFISLLFSLIFVTRQELYTKYKYMIFFVIGIIVCYFDLLTFESITLSLPLLLAESQSGGEDKLITRVKRVSGVSLLWLLGYAAMFLTKWLFYIFVGGDEAKNLIAYKIAERTTGSNTSQQFTVMESLRLNVSALKHFTFDNWYVVPMICCILLAAYIYLARGIHKDFNTSFILLLAGLIPIARFILIREHSATHCFFTYHALLTTVIAVVNPFLQLLGKLQDRQRAIRRRLK